MRKIFTLLFISILLLTTVTLYAQQSASSNNRNGVIYGKLIDEHSLLAVKDASIQILYSAPNSTSETPNKELLISAQLTNKIGEFYFENLPEEGSLILKIERQGYKPQSINVIFVKKETLENNNQNTLPIKALGTIKLQKDEVILENIDVKGHKDLIIFGVDKKIYNVEKDLLSTGGTTLDIIKNLPSAFVQIDGSVLLRNETPLCFIDGKPTTLSFDQIPADQVSEIEVITNPSAKYNGSGTTGIINIILKKNKKVGYFGNLRTQIDSRAKPGFAADFNLKRNKINFFVAGNLLFKKSKNFFSTNRWDTFPNGTAFYKQNNQPINNSVFIFGRTGIDYKINNRNSLSIYSTITDGSFHVKDKFHTYTDSTYLSIPYKEYALRTLDVNAGFTSIRTEANYLHVFADPHKQLSMDIQYLYYENQNTSNYNSFKFDGNNLPKPAQGALKATGGGHNNIWDFQTDFSNQFRNRQKIEVGMRINLKDYYNWNDNFLIDPPSQISQILTQIGIRYTYQERTFAGYAAYSKEFKKLNYNIALRAENSFAVGNFINRNLEISNQFPLSFFPSASVSYNISTSKTIQMNYSRKIFRPGIMYLVPFVDFSDSLNLSVGNPSLKPEYTQTAEINFNYQATPSHVLLVSLYGKLTDQVISKYQYNDTTINPSKPGRYYTYGNGKNNFAYGLEVINKNSWLSWWDLTANVNLFHNRLNASNLIQNGFNQKTSFSVKLFNQIYLGKTISVQISGDYQSSTLIPGSSNRNGNLNFAQTNLTYAQGYLAANYAVDFGIKTEFWKKKSGSLTFQISDVFRSRIYKVTSSDQNFNQTNTRRRDPQLARLTFNYRFGKHDMGLFKRKDLKNDLESIQNIQGTP